MRIGAQRRSNDHVVLHRRGTNYLYLENLENLESSRLLGSRSPENRKRREETAISALSLSLRPEIAFSIPVLPLLDPPFRLSQMSFKVKKGEERRKGEGGR